MKESRYRVEVGDCRDRMKELEAESIDSIVTDPPYGLSFMGKEWDYGVPGSAFWVEALRVAKPGAHLLAFGGTRTFHRLAVAIEDAGWEIRDCVMWLYGSGFPKSHNIGKAIDKEAGAVREKIRTTQTPNYFSRVGDSRPWLTRAASVGFHEHDSNTPATADAARWEGWGTALKPAWEPVLVCRKPIAAGMTVAGNVVAHGCGALNVDACRIPMGSEYDPNAIQRQQNANGVVNFVASYMIGKEIPTYNANGRWPANIIHDGSDEVSDPLGSAARFFYCAKASKADRDDGCDGLKLVTHQSVMGGAMPVDDDGNSRDRFKAQSRNHHPTVKPTSLMRYLCRLVTPPGGTVLDPFTGSGSTGRGAMHEGFNFIGFELSPEYAEIARARIAACVNSEALF